MNRVISFILSLVILAVGLSACSREGNPVESSTEGATSSERLTTAESTTLPVTSLLPPPVESESMSQTETDIHGATETTETTSDSSETLPSPPETTPKVTEPQETRPPETLPPETQVPPEAVPILRIDRSQLNIGAYGLQPYAGDREHIKDIALCGIDFMLVVNDAMRDTLGYMEEFGVGAITVGTMPGWCGGSGLNGQMKYHNPLTLYESSAQKFLTKDHPAIWGVDLGDEPSALDFSHLGKAIKRVRELLPEQHLFVNLYPIYATAKQNGLSAAASQLGVSTYQDYIEKYCQYIDLDYISYDFYMYGPQDNLNSVGLALENLRIVSEACNRYDKDLWIALQANSSDNSYWISTNELRYQAFSSMAYGAKTIMWACYTEGWWTNNVLDKNGNKTQQYDKLKTVNAEIHTIGETFMEYDHVASHLVGYDGTPLEGQSSKSFSNTLFSNVKDVSGKPLIIGEMALGSDKGGALMICASNDPFDNGGSEYQITFRVSKGKTVRAIGGNGDLTIEAQNDGTYTVKMYSNEGVLITVNG